MAAFRAGDHAAAAAICETIVAATPKDAGAHYVLGVAREALGALADAREALDTALALAPERTNFRITAGTLALAAGDDVAAEAHFRAALARDPNAAPAHTNLGTALKRQGRLAEAVEAFRAGLALTRGSRWWGVPPTAPHADSERASRARLTHDAEQLAYLLERRAVDPALGAEPAHYDDVLAALGDGPLDHPEPLDPPARSAIGATFGRVYHRMPDDDAPAPVIDPALDAAAVTARYQNADPSIAVVDDLLTPDALALLQRACLETTMWFDCKEHGGYLGAYLHEGFDHRVLIGLAEALPDRFPGILRRHGLAQMWAFKYSHEGRGTRKHADKAAININLWITPDEACRAPAASGMTIYDVAAPSSWRFDRYNVDDAALEREVAAHARRPTVVPYQCNRAVIFDSSLIHESGAVRFRPGYANRRVNVTMLYGERCEG